MLTPTVYKYSTSILLNRILCIQLELAHNETIYIKQKVSGININIHSLFINH